jgi:hypothetical protein
MRVIHQNLCQIQHAWFSLRYVNCGPGHIQCIYSSAYSFLNIQPKVVPLLLEISRQFNAHYTANLVPNTGHTLQFSLCEQWSRTYTKYLQLRIYMRQYSMERICAAIGDNRTFRSPLYCKLGAKYSAHHPIYHMWTAVPNIYNVITPPVFRLQYSADRICAPTGDISTILCALYWKLGA